MKKEAGETFGVKQKKKDGKKMEFIGYVLWREPKREHEKNQNKNKISK